MSISKDKSLLNTINVKGVIINKVNQKSLSYRNEIESNLKYIAKPKLRHIKIKSENSCKVVFVNLSN